MKKKIVFFSKKKFKRFFRCSRMGESVPKGYERGHSVKLDVDGDFKVYSLRVPKGFDIELMKVNYKKLKKCEKNLHQKLWTKNYANFLKP